MRLMCNLHEIYGTTAQILATNAPLCQHERPGDLGKYLLTTPNIIRCAHSESQCCTRIYISKEDRPCSITQQARLTRFTLFEKSYSFAVGTEQEFDFGDVFDPHTRCPIFKQSRLGIKVAHLW